MDPSDIQVEHDRPHRVDVIRGSSFGPVQSDTIHSSKKCQQAFQMTVLN